MFRSAYLSACLLCTVALASASAETTDATRNPNRKIMPGHHRPVYTRYGHHGLTWTGLTNLFRPNGSGLPRKGHFRKSKHSR